MRALLISGMACALAACHQSPDATAIETNAALLQDSLERQADNMEAMADQAADPNAAEAMENVADHLEDMKGNVADAADAAKDRLQR